MSEQESSQPAPTQCSAGCGFFANMGMGSGSLCSKCFRDQESKREVKLEAMPTILLPLTAPPQSMPIAIPTSITNEPTTTTNSPSQSNGTPGSSGPCRCNVETCRKKLGLIGFKCKCGLSFCGSHRDAESHSCQFDYKSHGRGLIASANPLIQADKVQRL